MKFKLKATVRRTVLDTISVKVDADTLDEALGLACIALAKYPAPHDRPQVGYIYVDNRANLDTEVVSVVEDIPDNEQRA